jgi:TetR/AcrR family transcriptional regulator, transcriptional repressor for nem operon
VADTQAPERASKRERLIQGARKVFYQQGFERTTLNDIAEASGVPVGNIYYYFKTKEALVEAAVNAYDGDRSELLRRVERKRTPKARLKAFLDELGNFGNSVAEYGCPFGTLSSELDKHYGTTPSPESQELLVPMIDWSEQQFRAMGLDDARELGIALIAGYEGAALLTHSLRDPDVLKRQLRRLQRWIDELPEPTAATA